MYSNHMGEPKEPGIIDPFKAEHIKNKVLARRVLAIYRHFMGSSESLKADTVFLRLFGETETKSLKLEEKDDTNHWVTIIRTPTNARESSLGVPISQDLRRPIYQIEENSHDTRNMISSPYGQVPKDALGFDGNLYSFRVVYFLNIWGQAAKYYDIYEWKKEEGESLEELLEDLGINKEKLPVLDFTPYENDSGLNPLEENDYKKISDLLTSIEKDSFRLWSLEVPKK